MTAIQAYFTLPPDWKSGLALTRSWQTGMQTAVTGEEKRSALWSWPRRSLKFQINVTTQAEAARIRRLLWAHLHQVWGLPLWPHGTGITARAWPGDTSLTVEDTRYRDLAAGSPIIITNDRDGTSYEAAVIAETGLTQTLIPLAAPLTLGWTAGLAMVYPLLAARLKASQTVSHQTAGLLGMTVTATEAYE